MSKAYERSLIDGNAGGSPGLSAARRGPFVSLAYANLAGEAACAPSYMQSQFAKWLTDELALLRESSL